jgi:hypothetical protein
MRPELSYKRQIKRIMKLNSQQIKLKDDIEKNKQLVKVTIKRMRMKSDTKRRLSNPLWYFEE